MYVCIGCVAVMVFLAPFDRLFSGYHFVAILNRCFVVVQNFLINIYTFMLTFTNLINQLYSSCSTYYS